MSDLGKRIVCAGCMQEETCRMDCGRKVDVEMMISQELFRFEAIETAYRKLSAHHGNVEHEVMELRAEVAALKKACHGGS